MKMIWKAIPIRIGREFGPSLLGILPIAGVLMLPACITLKAPEKPIEINLNVKVQQEVIVRLQKDAQDLISNNPELFPQ
ncbi:MAG: YnbE family lipoprotein [Sphingobium sp.]